MNELTESKDIIKLTLPTPFAVGDVNVFLVKGDRLTLIDAGAKTEEAWFLFQQKLAELGITPHDIEQVVITHHHPDHVGLLDYLPDDIEVVGHPRNQPWISRDENFFQHHDEFYAALFMQLGVHPAYVNMLSQLKKPLRYSCQRSLTNEVTEGDSISGLAGWAVLETPGHAQSHIALYRENDGFLIGGDLLLATISSNPLIEPPAIGEKNRSKAQLQYNDSLKKLLQYEIVNVLPGHGEDITDPHDLIKKRLAKQEERAYSVRNMLKEKPLTAFEVCERLFPTIFQKQLALTISETVGQLDFLEDLGEITIDSTKQQWRYYVD